MEQVTLEALRVVGQQVRAPFAELGTAVPGAWSGLFLRAFELGERVQPEFVELSLGEVNGVYTEIVGALMPPGFPPPSGMVAADLPAARYLRERHDGPLAEIADTYGRMLAWAAEEGLTVDSVKLDQGYTADGDEVSHLLHIRLAVAG